MIGAMPWPKRLWIVPVCTLVVLGVIALVYQLFWLLPAPGLTLPLSVGLPILLAYWIADRRRRRRRPPA
jgi:hypothetical protein